MSETMGELIERHQKELKVRATAHGDSHTQRRSPPHGGAVHLSHTIPSLTSIPTITLTFLAFSTHTHTWPPHPKSVQNKGKKMLKKVPRGDFEAR